MITRVQLERLDACAMGLRAFEAVYPNGLDLKDWTFLEQLRVLQTELRPYFAWAVLCGLVPLWSMAQTDLRGADLSAAILPDSTDLFAADLSRSNLRKIYGKYTVLSNANLEGANLEGATFEDAIFCATRLMGTDCRYANFRRTRFFEANFQGADCRHANFRGADCRRANFRGANLEGAIFEGAIFEGGWIPERSVA